MLRARTVISALVLLLATAGGTFAQDVPVEESDVEEVRLLDVILDIRETSQYLVSAVRITLPAGVSAQALSTPGPLVILVERGQLTIGGSPDPDRGYAYRVAQGERIAVPAGARIRPRNETDAPVTFLAVTLIPGSASQEEANR